MPSSPERPVRAGGMGGPEGKLRGRPPPPHCRAPDLGDGRGLNPSPDERKPAGGKYYSTHAAKTTLFANTKIHRQGRAVRSDDTNRSATLSVGRADASGPGVSLRLLRSRPSRAAREVSSCIPPGSSTSLQRPSRRPVSSSTDSTARRRSSPAGQSLIPLMKLRFARSAGARRHQHACRPRHLAEEDGGLRVGALVRHKTCERSELLGGPVSALSARQPR